MSIPHLVAIASWPLIGLAFVLAIVAQIRGTRSEFMRFLRMGLVLAPVIAMYEYRQQTALNLLMEDVEIIVAGICLCFGGYIFWRDADKLSQRVVRKPRF
jgi:hypothetical protein